MKIENVLCAHIAHDNSLLADPQISWVHISPSRVSTHDRDITYVYITAVSMVCATVCSVADQRKYKSTASLAFLMEIHLSPVNSPHKGPVTWKMFLLDHVITAIGMNIKGLACMLSYWIIARPNTMTPENRHFHMKSITPTINILAMEMVSTEMPLIWPQRESINLW